MRVQTKFFGEVELDDNKVIEFPNGIIGFEDFKKFAIIYDIEDDRDTKISWLQSLEEPTLALPVVDPLAVTTEYAPMIEDELLKPLGNPADEDLLFLLVMTVPSDMTKVTANMKAPVIISTEERKGVQLIVDNADYPVKFNVYESVQKMKEKAGE
ncbi:flagellar assembly factor FliW [Clostridium sp. CAG:590]|jgi:flagellar assembly factor FliW|nr:flagellar assembly protein FliW [Clostridium sp.]CCX89417.1 flagellar assembly factor FliW [Clostridium sp. CAG:590]